MKWYESSSELVFRQYGPIFDEKLIALIKLDEFYRIDPCDIKYLPKEIEYQYDPQLDYLFEGEEKNKEEWIELEKTAIYERYFHNYKTNLIYTIGSFLFFLDRIKEIENKGEEIQLSMYFYYLNAIKSLGDSVGLMKNITKLIIFSRVFHKDKSKDEEIKKKYEKELIVIYEDYLAYAKAYRDYVVHKDFSRFFTDFTVPKLEIEYLKNPPEDHIVDLTCKKYKASDLLNELFEDVARGINEASKYLIGEVLRCPKGLENLK